MLATGYLYNNPANDGLEDYDGEDIFKPWRFRLDENE